MPYKRKNKSTEKEYEVDNDFSNAKLSGFSSQHPLSVYNNVKITGVHEVSDLHLKTQVTEVNVEYSLFKVDTDVTIWMTTDKGLSGTPLECARACVDVGDWFFVDINTKNVNATNVRQDKRAHLFIHQTQTF